MDKKEIIEFIRSNPEQEIYHKYLIGQEVWYFKKFTDDHSSTYDEFKKFISIKLKVPFNNISIVGSAKTRFSLSPKKGFKEFDDKSDFDLIIVSRLMYETIWSAYREISQQGFLPQYQYKCQNVFNGFVSIRDTDPVFGNDSLVEWQRIVRTFKADVQLKFNIQHEINYRIYADWESVQDYHIRGISKLKGIMHETN